MTLWWKNKLARLLAGVIVAAFTLAWAMGEVRDSRETARRDKHEVARMTQKMKTLCIGRFLIDMPEEAQVELVGPRIHGFQIAAYPETDQEFRTRLADREQQLGSKPDRLGGNKNLELAKEVKTRNGIQGKIFVHGRNVVEGTQANGLELETYRYEGVAVEALLHGNGVSVDLEADNYDPDRIANISRLVAQLVPNPENKPATAPGFCINYAYFLDPIGATQREEVIMRARLPSHPDIRFMLISAAGSKPEKQGLLERAAASDSWLLKFDKRVSRIRGAKRTISGLAGDELVERFVEDNHAVVYSHWWEVNGTEDDVLVPHISFTMDTGKGETGPVPSTLSEAAALGLWDAILTSFRVRPTESQKQPVDAQAIPPIGTGAFAGDICPQTGWWQCGDGGDGVEVLGGRRQYIKQGARMPQALLLPAQTFWEKVRGVQPSFEAKTRTLWKLIDKRARNRGIPHAVLVSHTDAPTSGIAQTPVAIGSVMHTGASCPVSGWWQCEDASALDGSRWFPIGSVFPPATLSVPPGSFPRKSGSPQLIHRRGAWRLMRVADAPNGIVDTRRGDLGEVDSLSPKRDA